MMRKPYAVAAEANNGIAMRRADQTTLEYTVMTNGTTRHVLKITRKYSMFKYLKNEGWYIT